MYMKEGFPFVYQILFDINELAFLVQINPRSAELKPALEEKSLLVENIQRTINPSYFETDILKNFGYEGVCINKGIIDNLLILTLPIPVVVYFSDDDCSECGGRGISKYTQDECWRCRGTGRKRHIKNELLYNLSATLSVLCKYLNSILWDKRDISVIHAYGPQLATLEFYVEREMNGAPIGGECSRSFVQNLRVSEASSVIDIMMSIDKHMENAVEVPQWGHYNREYDFKCSISEGRFYLEVPGQNASCLYIENREHSDGIRGLSCHNIDSPWQQLTLLGGFASLWNIVAENTVKERKNSKKERK